jgi:hypothetical protein
MGAIMRGWIWGAAALSLAAGAAQGAELFAVSAASGELKAYTTPTLTQTHDFLPFGAGAVGVSVGASNDDGRTTLVVGAGPGGQVVKVYDTASGDQTAAFNPFDAGYTGGVRVAAGDVNGDGFADIAVGAGQGGSQVRVFDGAGGLTPLKTFNAFDAGFTGGISVALGEGDDGHAEIIVGALTGGIVKVFDFETLALKHNFFAFDPAYLGGVNVAFGRELGHGVIIAGQAADGSNVKLFSLTDGSLLEDFDAFGPDYTGGVSVAGGSFGGFEGVIVGGRSGVKVLEANRQSLLASFAPFGDSDGGINVAGTFDAVPEPATWTLMLLGVFGLGAAARRRRVLPA